MRARLDEEPGAPAPDESAIGHPFRIQAGAMPVPCPAP